MAETVIPESDKVNLMANSESQKDNTSSSFSVSVHDEDKQTNVPADIISENGVGFWERSDVRMWLYILAGTVIIFAIVFAVLSKETSLFKGYTVTDNGQATESDEEEQIFDQFNGQAATETSDDDDGSGPVTESTTNEVISANNNPVGTVVDNNNNQVTESTDQETILDNLDFEPITDPGGLNENDLGFDDRLLSDVPAIPFTEADIINEFNFGDSLGSNTNANIMSAAQVQGDTGPALWLAMMPSMLYALARKKK